MPTALLCAGGTGGHMFPAEALAHELIARGWKAHLATDDRGMRFASTFPGDVTRFTFRPPNMRRPDQIVLSAFAGIQAYRKARQLVAQLQPKVAVGFGGYPTLAPMFGALHKGVATAIHEQNAVLGRANKLLASRVNVVAGGFDLPGQNATTTGNPIRPAGLAVAGQPYEPSSADMPFNLVIFGGSQGAQFFSQTFPQAIALLPQDKRARLRVVLQSRADDVVDPAQVLAKAGVQADVAPFFADMPARLAKAHFVVSRAGASTVSELALIGRPSLLIPYPHALDHDQAANAAMLQQTGGTQVRRQEELNASVLADIISEAMDAPERLAKQAQAATQAAIPNAASRLADLVEATAV